MSEPTPKQLLNIAQTYFNSNMTTLQARQSDRLDFYEVSVWNIEAALKAAYALGQKDRNGKEDE